MTSGDRLYLFAWVWLVISFTLIGGGLLIRIWDKRKAIKAKFLHKCNKIQPRIEVYNRNYKRRKAG